MPKLKTIEDLNKLREQARRDLRHRLEAGTRITVGMGSCGSAAGARETMYAILEELDKGQLAAHVLIADCRGRCSEEPLVEIRVAGQPTVTYRNIHPDRVPRLIEEHLVRGMPIADWVLAPVPGAASCQD
jgi:NADP-reducing hydrogenase subunit HndB